MTVSRYYSSAAVETALTAPISGSSTSITVGSVAGFPILYPYTLSIDADNGNKELVEVSAAVSTTLTVTRGIDGTSNVSHSLGAKVSHDHSARDFRESREHEDSTVAHGATGAVVGTTNTQALTHKDLTDASNTFPSSLATDAEVTSAIAASVAAEHSSTATLTNKDLSSGTNTFPSSLATASEVTSAISAATTAERVATATLTHKDLTSGTNAFPASLPAISPLGVISPYAGATAPTNYLLCDGSAVSRTTYAALFAITSTAFGVGDGSTTFNVPNLKGRIPVGIDSAQTEFDARGETGGEKTHVLTTGELAAHTHLTNQKTAFANFSLTLASTNPSSDAVVARGSASGALERNFDNFESADETVSAGGDGAHNNLQPYIALNYIIRAL